MSLDNQTAPSIEEQTTSPLALKTASNFRRLITGLGLVAAVSGLTLAMLPSFAQAEDDVDDDNSPAAKPSGFNVVLVHGAFADASSWNAVTKILQKQGHNVVAVQLPLSSLADDVAVTKQVLASAVLAGPTVLVGHSYGGAVITGAASDAKNVIGLVYASAFVPVANESLAHLIGKYAPPEAVPHIIPSYPAGYAWIDPSYYPQVFAADIKLKTTQVLAVSQKPLAFRCFDDTLAQVAPQSLPAWYLVSKQDKTINPDLERFMAQRRAATTIELDSSHASPLSHPDAVVGLVEAAIKAYKKA